MKPQEGLSVGGGTDAARKAAAAALIKSAKQADFMRDHFSALFWAAIAPINNVAIMETKTAYDTLCHAPNLFKQKVKASAKCAMLRIEKYDKAVIRTMQNNMYGDRRQYWLDYSDEYYEALRHDIGIFRLTILQVLTKAQEPDREIKAQVVLAETMLRYAVGMFDEYFKKVQTHHGVDLKPEFADARLHYVFSPWYDLCDILCRSHQQIDIDQDKQVRLAFRIIENRIVNMNRLQDIGEKALAYNPDIEKEIHQNPLSANLRHSITAIFR